MPGFALEFLETDALSKGLVRSISRVDSLFVDTVPSPPFVGYTSDFGLALKPLSTLWNLQYQDVYRKILETDALTNKLARDISRVDSFFVATVP
jgi:hypothetical protein